MTTCCFDKTGTLTSDKMVLEGVAGAPGTGAEGAAHVLVTDAKALPVAVGRVLAGCQSLVLVEGALVGDPVERAAVDASGERRDAMHLVVPGCAKMARGVGGRCPPE